MKNKSRSSDNPREKQQTLQLYTLGKFEIRSSGKLPKRSRKAQHKPLAMIKALIAFGGRNVSKEALTDILWPDSEGDAATQSFATTLHRLRKLLGNKNAIMLNDGLISLNPDVCWVDTWAFESLIDAAGNDLARNHKYIAEAVSLYKGHFLPADEGQPWTTSIRERLRSKFLRNAEKLCAYWEKQGDLNKAVDCYHEALEVDDLSENVYRNLMSCYDRLGQKADAILAYNRCCKVFEAVLGTKPSKKTEALYRSIIAE